MELLKLTAFALTLSSAFSAEITPPTKAPQLDFKGQWTGSYETILGTIEHTPNTLKINGVGVKEYSIKGGTSIPLTGKKGKKHTFHSDFSLGTNMSPDEFLMAMIAAGIR